MFLAHPKTSPHLQRALDPRDSGQSASALQTESSKHRGEQAVMTQKLREWSNAWFSFTNVMLDPVQALFIQLGGLRVING